jgi:FlaA1/EpsC-like NDP-sugar epimerase
LRPGQDIAIEYIGVRLGEKLHEELLSPGEERLATAHPKIFCLRQNNQQLNGRFLAHQISNLIELADAQRNDEVIETLWKLVRAKGRLRSAAPFPHRVGQ